MYSIYSWMYCVRAVFVIRDCYYIGILDFDPRFRSAGLFVLTNFLPRQFFTNMLRPEDLVSGQILDFFDFSSVLTFNFFVSRIKFRIRFGFVIFSDNRDSKRDLCFY